MTRGFGAITPYKNGYRARIYVAGERKQRLFPRGQMAREWLAGVVSHKVDVLAGAQNPRGTGPHVTLEQIKVELLDDLRANRTHTDGTIADYASQLNRLARDLGGRRLAELRDRDVTLLVKRWREEDLSTSRIRHLLDRLSQVREFCGRQHYTGRLNFQVKRPRLVQRSIRDAVPVDELARLEAAALADFDRRAGAAVLLAARAGLRATETVQLRVEDVYLGRRYVGVEVRGERSDRTKTGEARTVPMDEQLHDALKALAMTPAAPGTRLLGVGSRDKLSAIVARPRRAAGLAGPPQIYRLRHLYASAQAMRVPLPLRQKRLGHRTILTTMRCVPVTDELPAELQLAAAKKSRFPHPNRHGRVTRTKSM